MLANFKKQLQSHLQEAFQKAYPKEKQLPSIEFEIPSDKKHGEFSSNVALKSAKIFKKAPLGLAEEILKIFQESLAGASLNEKILKIEVKKPGFVNFYLAPETIFEILGEVFKQDKNYGSSDFGKKEKIQIEFVSANPTGPLSIAHARQAAVGDALANILNFLGFKISKEYYVNDGGNQIVVLGQSIQLRAKEILGDDIARLFKEIHYQGEYVKDIARKFIEKEKIKDYSDIDMFNPLSASKFGAEYLLEEIKNDLNDFGVHFDVWSFESKIAPKDKIEDILAYLGEKGFLYEKDGALWFKSTDFGDDKDRVVEKSNGAYTYLTPDIVYHKDKYDRGFNRVFNIWGPDHHGYISRLKAAVEALGRDREALEVLIVQLATIYRDGKAIPMSTRKGQYITLREVMNEVGVDAARFFFLMRHISAHLDFDLELAKKETSENPVYYIQYGHARVYSINKTAKDAKVKMKTSGFSLLKEDEELDLIKKLGSFPDALMHCYDQLDPYPLISYLQDLAAGFHKFYDRHRVVTADPALSGERLGLVNAVRIVLANGLRLLGVSTPEKM